MIYFLLPPPVKRSADAAPDILRLRSSELLRSVTLRIFKLIQALYAAFIIDVFSRAIVGWKVSTRMNTDMVLDALEQALHDRGMPKNVIHHSDRGVQYLSIRYTHRLEAANPHPSYPPPFLPPQRPTHPPKFQSIHPSKQTLHKTSLSKNPHLFTL